MAGDGEDSLGGRGGRCPRCDICGTVVRVRGVGREGVWCGGCMGAVLPFNWVQGGGDFQGEYREGLGSRAAEFRGLRFDPFDAEVRGALGGAGVAMGACGYREGGELGGQLRGMARDGGCGLSLVCLNIRSAKGPGMELLEAELRRWSVRWVPEIQAIKLGPSLLKPW